MAKTIRLLTLIALLVLVTASGTMAVTRVAKTMHVVDFYAGTGTVVGAYSGIPSQDFLINNRLVDVDGEDLYDDPFSFAFGYGQVYRGKMFMAVKFRYTSHELMDTIPLLFDTILVFNPGLKLRQYDLVLDINYQPLDLSESVITPFGGLGIQAGLTSESLTGFDTESQLNLALSLNFGAEVKLFTSPSKRSYLTVASANRWDFLATGDRPKYLNFGGALRYYFRP